MHLQEILDARPHIRQADTYVLAPLKQDAHALLVRAGLRHEGSSRGRDDSLRQDESVPGKALDRAGLITDEPLLMLGSVKDTPIVRVAAEGPPVVVAHWRYEPGARGRGLYVELAERARR